MYKARIILFIILLFNGLTATVGSVLLLLRPDGSLLRLPEVWLKDAPFPDYTWPGIILLVSNGLLSLFIARITWRDEMQFSYWALLQGFILCGWLTIQIIMLGAFYAPMHLTYYTLGLAMIVLGFMLQED